MAAEKSNTPCPHTPLKNAWCYECAKPAARRR